VDEHVRDGRAGVLRYHLQVIRDREAVRLPRLGHHVRDVHHRPGEGGQSLPHPTAQQCGNGASEEATRAQDHHIRALDRLDNARRGQCFIGFDGDLLYSLPRRVYRRLAPGDGAVGVVGYERQALLGRREDPPLDAQKASRLLDPLRKPPGHICERRDNDVSDRMIRELAAPTLEAVVKDLGQLLPPGERDQAVPDVARRRHPEFLSEPSARPAIVRHGNDRDEIPGEIPEPL